MPNSNLPVKNIPQSLCQWPQWVCWKYVERNGRRTKVPINARFGWNASATDPQSWSTFEAACEAYMRSDSLAGIGFVFTNDDPFAGIDMDNCLDDQGNFAWGREIVDELASYSEVSPSRRGIKIFLRATKPEFAKCRRDGFGPDGRGELEIYDQGRFFAVTGRTLAHTRADVAIRQSELDRLCTRLWPNTAAPAEPPADQFAACLQAIRAMHVPDHNDGSHRLFSACCRCVEHNLSDAESIACIRDYEREQPFPTAWSDADILKRLRDAEERCQRGLVVPKITVQVAPTCKSVAQLLIDHPELRAPVIHGLLRTGESMNVIAPSKIGKSWLVTDLALSLATGRKWLGTFETEMGNVLVLDNELHAETSAHRILKIALARDIDIQDVGQSVFIDNLRGRLSNVFSLSPYFKSLQPGFFRIIILDAFYRFLPKDADENNNANLTDIYNQIDWYAAILGCSFVLVHHASKGNQSGKSITDVGAGAGSQSRATDTHVILRPHEKPDCVVLEAAVRSWPPVEPRVLRWTFPVWTPDDSLDPSALRPERAKRARKAVDPEKPQKPEWTAERLATELARAQPIPRQALLDSLTEHGVSQKRAKLLLTQAEAAGLIFRWSYGANKPIAFATVPQQLVRAAGKKLVCVRSHPPRPPQARANTHGLGSMNLFAYTQARSDDRYNISMANNHLDANCAKANWLPTATIHVTAIVLFAFAGSELCPGQDNAEPAAAAKTSPPGIDELLLFFPAKHPAGDWSPKELVFQDVWFSAKDETRIHAWYCPCVKPRATVLIAHGNAGNIAMRANWLRYLQTQMRVSTFTFDYRGYGRSEGIPTVDGALQDARAAKSKLLELTGLKDSDIVLMGESLGGAIAIQLAVESAPRALVIQSTFPSLKELADIHYPKLSWLVPQSKLNSASQIRQVRCPLFQSHGTADRTIPLALGEKLFQLGNEPKTFVKVVGADHNNWLTQDYLRQLNTFIGTIERPGPN